jgi:hypothetical protein
VHPVVAIGKTSVERSKHAQSKIPHSLATRSRPRGIKFTIRNFLSGRSTLIYIFLIKGSVLLGSTSYENVAFCDHLTTYKNLQDSLILEFFL